MNDMAGNPAESHFQLVLPTSRCWRHGNGEYRGNRACGLQHLLTQRLRGTPPRVFPTVLLRRRPRLRRSLPKRGDRSARRRAPRLGRRRTQIRLLSTRHSRTIPATQRLSTALPVTNQLISDWHSRRRRPRRTRPTGSPSTARRDPQRFRRPPTTSAIEVQGPPNRSL